MDFYKPAVLIGDGKAVLEKPFFLFELYSKIAKNYGLEIQNTPDELKVAIQPEQAARSFKREVPLAVEKLLEYEKEFRKFTNTDFILKYLKSEPQIEEAAGFSLSRLIEKGEDLAGELIPQKFAPEKLKEFFATPRGMALLFSEGGRAFLKKYQLSGDNLVSQLQSRKEIDLGELFSPELLPDRLGITDTTERLGLEFAIADRLTRKKKAGIPESAFASELRGALGG